MAVSTFEGVVENGRIRLPEDVVLPEQTRVYVVIPDLQGVPQARIRSPRLAHPEQMADFAKQIIEVASDAEL
jgi:hypothetical protein